MREAGCCAASVQHILPVLWQLQATRVKLIEGRGENLFCFFNYEKNHNKKDFHHKVIFKFFQSAEHEQVMLSHTTQVLDRRLVRLFVSFIDTAQCTFTQQNLCRKLFSVFPILSLHLFILSLQKYFKNNFTLSR